MAFRFFADHCISNLIIRTLVDAGHLPFCSSLVTGHSSLPFRACF
jgi:hypothetical protein